MDILIGIVVNLLSSVIFEILKPVIPFIKARRQSGNDNALDETYPENPSHGPHPLPVSVYERRRQRAKQFLVGIILYMFHCSFVLFAFDVTVDLIGGKNNMLYLDQARFVGRYLPHTPLTNLIDVSSRSGIIRFLVLVILCFFVGWMLALPFVKIGAYFGRFDQRFRGIALIYACLFTYILLAVHTAWLFTNLDYFNIWLKVSIVMGIWFLLAYIGSLFSKKRKANRY